MRLFICEFITGGGLQNKELPEGLIQEGDVVEINPRLTTSYVGLRQSLDLNPAELILSIWQNREFPEGDRKEDHEKQFLPVNLLLEKTNVV